MIIAHLITNDGLPKSLDESCHRLGILPLIREPNDGTLFQQFLAQFSDFFERATTGRKQSVLS